MFNALEGLLEKKIRFAYTLTSLDPLSGILLGILFLLYLMLLSWGENKTGLKVFINLDCLGRREGSFFNCLGSLNYATF